MRFTSASARDEYAQIGLYAMRAPELYWRVAARVEARMRERCGGRMFMAAHVRRGDCKFHLTIYFKGFMLILILSHFSRSIWVDPRRIPRYSYKACSGQVEKRH